MASKRIMTDDLLTLLAEHAARLRKAGVRSFSCNGITAELLPPEPEAVARPVEWQAGQGGALNDPDTYAYGRVPGYELEPDEVD